ncbi:MAG TPA: hypothetical protein VKC35_09530 [Vicinamibacterales bacterium]|nr:hypothetical protein [Vicinamibacterales bacterium]
MTSERLWSDHPIDGLAAAALYFDVFARPKTMLLDLLEQPAAAAAANLDPPDVGIAVRCDLVRRKHANSKYRITIERERSRTRNLLRVKMTVKSELHADGKIFGHREFPRRIPVLFFSIDRVFP